MSEIQDNQTANEESPAKRYWLDDIRNVHKLFWALVAVCALLFVSDAFYEKHVIFPFENWFGFFGLFGFFLSFALVLTARELRKLLKRDEDYYDR
ncbi:MAG: hypothetical protein HOO19_14320 [Rhodospirillaceae bacterium]|nr:hypothetical protein [Rhodospirillaceae bacterium]MBT7234668.1 hypothetical protein [Rhodospirillaceae bacterium]